MSSDTQSSPTRTKLFEVFYTLAQQFSSHPFRIIIVSFAILFSWLDWINTPPLTLYETIFSIAHITMAFALLFSPRLGYLGLLALEFITCYLPVDNGPSRFWGIYCAIGLTTYEDGLSIINILAMLSFITIQSYQEAQANNGSIDFSDMTVFLMYTITAMIIGYGFQWWKERNEKQADTYHDNERELYKSYRLRDNDNAIKLHDSVAQRFTTIQLISQSNIHDNQNEYDTKEWQTINNLASKGLEETRYIIDLMLHEDIERRSSVHSSAWWLAVEHIADKGDTLLHDKGYVGKTELMDGGVGIQPISKDDITTLRIVLEELYANIAKHAALGSEYQASITLRDKEAEIVMSNIIRSPIGEKTKGQGLESRIHRLKLIGGELEYEIDDDTWITYARIPFFPTSSCTQCGVRSMMRHRCDNHT